MERVIATELDYTGDGSYTWRGKPFTGIAFWQTNDGKVTSEQYYRDGHATGPGWSWFPSGTLATESNSLAGVFHGVRREWSESGTLSREEMFERGICLWRKRWNDQGVQIEEYWLQESHPDYQVLTILRSAF